jgi:serine/threonine protein kinase
VYKGVHIPTGAVVALKIINLDQADDDTADIQREVALLSQLRAENNNITKYYGCYLDGPQVWIVMDFANGGSVRTLMKCMKGGVLEERWMVIIMREVLIALAYLHKSNVIHRDIKTANVLVQSTGKVMLCDFGVSALLSTSQSKRTTFIGTPHYMAPEVLTSSSYDSKADIWSLGITLYEMATGAQPLAEIPQLQAITLIPKVKPPRLPEQYGSKDMKDFINNCLRELPSDVSLALSDDHLA